MVSKKESLKDQYASCPGVRAQSSQLAASPSHSARGTGSEATQPGTGWTRSTGEPTGAVAVEPRLDLVPLDLWATTTGARPTHFTCGWQTGSAGRSPRAK